MKKIIVLKSNKQVVEVANTVTFNADGSFQADDTIYPVHVSGGFSVYEVSDTVDDTYRGKKCYDPATGFYDNPNYVVEIPTDERVKQLEQENEQLKGQLAQLNADLTDFMDYYFTNTPQTV